MPLEFIKYLETKLEHARGMAGVHALAQDKVRMQAAVAVAESVKEILEQAVRLAEKK